MAQSRNCASQHNSGTSNCHLNCKVRPLHAQAQVLIRIHHTAQYTHSIIVKTPLFQLQGSLNITDDTPGPCISYTVTVLGGTAMK
jgi:hypothetical protein